MNLSQPAPPILELKNLVTKFYTPEGVVHAVNGVSIDLRKGETLGVVGESGCGKSVTMLSALRLIPSPPGKVLSGQALFNGKDLLQLSDREIRDVRGAHISLISQDPMVSLNPVLTVGRQVAEPLVRHRGSAWPQAMARAAEMLQMVGIPEAEKRVKSYPHQFSGGMRQRAMIAMALICDPEILIADEPTTALDVTIQAQIIELVRQLCREREMSVIWITHDLGVVAGIAQRVIVMYAGFVIEDVLVDVLYINPQHPYTIGLLGSVPRLDRSAPAEDLATIPGAPPLMVKEPHACPFRPRCALAQPCCAENPPLLDVGPGHRAACWIDPMTRRSRQ